jgi:hypothetical protein
MPRRRMGSESKRATTCGGCERASIVLPTRSTHDHAQDSESATAVETAGVADLAGEEVGPGELCEEGGGDVGECDDPLGRVGRDEVEGGGEDDHVEHVVDQPEEEEGHVLSEQQLTLYRGVLPCSSLFFFV